MNVDIEKLRSLDEEKLSRLLYSVALATGADDRKARIASGKAAVFKSFLATASERDINKLVSVIGDNKTAEILEKLNL